MIKLWRRLILPSDINHSIVPAQADLPHHAALIAVTTRIGVFALLRQFSCKFPVPLLTPMINRV